MACLRTLAQTSALVALATTTLAAQAAHGRIVASPGGHPRIASIAPPPPPPRPLNYQLGETVFSSVPVIITPDGRVLINLGYGYEQVARNCPYAYGYGCESYGYPIAPMTPIVPTYGPPTYVPPRYAPPAYGAPTYAPTYPNPGYPPDGFYRPTPTPPAAPPGGCPRGYLPTGGNPPCIDPVVVPLPSSSYPASAAAPSPGPGAAPPRLAPYRPSTSNPPTVVRRR